MSTKKETVTLHVAFDGNDDNPGTETAPLATLTGAKDAIRSLRRSTEKPVRVVVHEGTYYLDRPFILGAEDSGTEQGPITYEACAGERVTLSGGRKLDCRWEPYRDGIMMCRLPDVCNGTLDFSQLFINGKRQIRARYPNADNSDPEHYSGYIQAAAAIDAETPDPCPASDDDMTFSSGPPRGIIYAPETFTRKRWARPQEAVIHIYQAYYWGNLQWQIRHIDWENRHIWFGHGGQQIGAKWFSHPCAVMTAGQQASRFFIENVFEELDAPGEWYLDREQGILYYMPEEGVALEEALVEVPVLQHVVEFKGTQQRPVCHITLSGFRIAHSASTYLESYEIPSLADWSIHRGGAVFFAGARNCTIANCWFDAPGGNAVFMNGYNRNDAVASCTFTQCGDSAICFVGYYESTVGTQKTFPYECKAVNNLIRHCGVFGKQVAGIYISRAKRITAGHNLIYDMPRAGICIGDGTWGGHIIEYNHIHNTCRETQDHGPLNAWGRDRGWCLAQSHAPHTVNRSHDAFEMLIDAMEPVIIRHNFFEEHSGWGLDLDDGASHYEVYNNLCVGVGIKLREGSHRTIYNNIWVDCANPPGFHVGNEDNHDRYFMNITVMSGKHMKPEDDVNFSMDTHHGEIYSLISPPAHGAWLEEIDHNCFFSDTGEFITFVLPRGGQERKYSLVEWRELGFDRNSVFADPMFVDPANNDYRVQPDSPTLRLGFKNFEMGVWGLSENSLVSSWAEESANL